MSSPSLWKRLLEGVLSIGETPGESETRRSGRRVFLLAFIIATLLRTPAVVARFIAGYTWVGVVDLVALVVPVSLLVVIAIRPASYVGLLRWKAHRATRSSRQDFRVPHELLLVPVTPT